MFIEELILKDFKSFGGTHRLPFDRGMTVIVGPNGSGKSNLLDGLRWVLGENNPSRLRINRQSDLLFQGSPSKNEASLAKVTLTLAGDDARATLERTVDENGTTITVDGHKMRQADLADVKASWGFGGDKFAFIGQGEITDQISLRPYARRLALEELFGVDRYRAKREEASKKLVEAEAELERLRALAAELQTRRDEIAPDMHKARQAADLEAQIATLTSRLYHLRRAEEELRLEELSVKLDLAYEAQARAEGWTKLWSAHAARQGDSSQAWALERSELNALLEELRPQEAESKATLGRLEAELSRDRSSLTLAQEDATRAQERYEESCRRRDAEAEETSRLASEEKRLATLLSELEHSWTQKNERQNQVADQCEELRARKSALAEELIETQGRIAALEASELEDSTALEASRDQLMTELADLELAWDKAEEEVDGASEKVQSLQEESLGLSRRVNALRAALAGKEGQLDSTLSTSGSHPAPVAHLLASARMGKLDFELVPVSETFHCPEEYVEAIEAFLGGRLSWVVLDRTSDAQKALNLLKKAQAGRATLLPLDKCRVPTRTLVADEGVVGWASDLVTSNSRWSMAVEHLLGLLLVVKDYATGARLSKGARYPLVTLEGEVFQPSGAISGGASKRMGPLQAKRAQEQLKAAMDADKEGLENLTRRGAEMSAELEKLTVALEEMKRQADGLRAQVESKRRQLRDVTGALDDLASRRAAKDERLQKLHQSTADLQAESEEIQARLAELLGEGFEDLSPQLTAARHEADLAASRAASAREALLTWTKRAMEDSSALERAQGGVKALVDRIEAGEKALLEAQKKDEDLRQGLEDAQQRLAKAEELWQRHSQGALRLVRHVENAKAAVLAANKNCEALTEERGRTQARVEELIQTYEEAYPYEGKIDDDASPDSVARALNKAERSLRELGAVNRGALDEDASLERRLNFLSEQRSDAQTGADSLKEVIASADDQASRVFASALHDIDERFNALFVRLFGGGEAHLTWDKKGGTWDGGVEITARPPGKRSLYLAQLSGGEQSLTALALLFAAMERAQVPLAVLDEVDAALDEVNLGRFADLATEYAKGVQLLCMTHRRQTMERAKRAFGVTMSEPGLSKVVGLELDQWS